MEKKKKNLTITAVVITAVVVIFASFFLYGNNKRYDFTEKNFISMDTVVTAKLYGEDTSVHIGPIMDIISGLEDKISRFDENSEVYRLNAEGRTFDQSVYEIIGSVKEICEATDGAFDVTVGELSDLWSIGKDGEKIPSQEEIALVLEGVGYKGLTLDGSQVLLEGGKVDLGAVGKGFACDLISAYLSMNGVEGAVISVGGSILAFGDYNKKGDQWTIGIRHPRNESGLLGVIRLDEGFVSTSGDYERYFEKDGKRYHHIFDAKTGMPASSGLISVTVVAQNGLLSDALSTACFIVGEEKGKELLAKYGASGIFVDEEMNITKVGEIDFEKQ